MNSNNWISVKDRLPQESMKVRWLCKDGAEDIGIFRKGERSVFATFDLRSNSEITHWQPILESNTENK